MTKAAKLTYRRFSGVEEDDRLRLIYQTAARVIHEKGYDATSINEIADAIGITKGALYHYIDGKQDLLFSIMSYALDVLEKEVVTPVAQVTDAEEQLRHLVALHARLIIDYAVEMTILLEEGTGLTAAHSRLITKRRMHYYKFVRAILKQLSDEGRLQAVDVTIATHNLIGQLQWLARWYNPAGRLSREQILDEFSKAAMLALLRPGLRLVSSQRQSSGTRKK